MENFDGGVKKINTTGDKIRKARMQKYMTQEQVAKKLGVKQKQISRWENDKAKPEIDTLIKISEILDISIDYLLRNDETYEITQRGKIHDNRKRATSKPQYQGLTKPQLELITVTEELDIEQQNEVLGAVKMYLSTKGYSKQA